MTAPSLRHAFALPSAPTIGIEEEVALLHPVTLDLLGRAAEVVARAAEPAVKTEMPAAQVELVSPPSATVGEAAGSLAAVRSRAVRAAEGIGLLAALGVHPFTASRGVLTEQPRTAQLLERFPGIAQRQLVFGLHVHVAVRPAERALAVANAMREHLPDLAALAANAPFYVGADTGLASVRPVVSALLPRQGVPPAFPTVEAYEEALGWGIAAGYLEDAGRWWWELRLSPAYGTLEVRVPDAQPTIGQAAAVAALVHALVGWLGQRHGAGDLPPPAETWRIAENRWSACRWGVEGVMADVRTGRRVATRDRVAALLADLGPAAAALGCEAELAGAARMLEDPAPARHRAIAADAGLDGLMRHLAADFDAAGRGITPLTHG